MTAAVAKHCSRSEFTGADRVANPASIKKDRGSTIPGDFAAHKAADSGSDGGSAPGIRNQTSSQTSDHGSGCLPVPDVGIG